MFAAYVTDMTAFISCKLAIENKINELGALVIHYWLRFCVFFFSVTNTFCFLFFFSVLRFLLLNFTVHFLWKIGTWTSSCYISNTRKSVSSDIQTLRSGLKKRGAAEFFFNQLRSVSISDETLFRVFDIASQSIDNSWRKSKQKFSEFYDN